MRRLVVYIAMIFIIYFFQTGVFTHLALGGIVPNLFIICTVTIGMIRGKKEGCLIGFFCGILMDALLGVYFGMYALVLSVIGYLAG